MSCQLSRRELLKASTVAGAGALFLPRNILAQGESPNEKLDVALIGLGNQGGFQVGGMEQTRQNVVALCDVDDRMVNQRKAAEKFPGAKRFYDFRQMYDEMLEKIDAETRKPLAVSPDPALCRRQDNGCAAWPPRCP